MHFTLTTTIVTALLSLAAASPLVARDASTVLGDLAKIKTDLGTLSSAVSGYSGGLSAALDIQTKESAVEKDVDKATADTNAAAAFTAGESTGVTNALLGLKPDITGAIDALVAKKSLFVSAGVSSIVKTDLQNLKSKTDTLSIALQNKATATDKDTIKSGTADVDAAFQSGLAAYA
ncbi:hydrophobic surface binding protein A-domain-containing protein [Aspergillus alliaceus]|uniref:Cell wall mannoprotein 1 n=1 Tax=Petromyces alliaceus TaxID=209559 RepID=A0A5N7CRT3_PETAA|nr:hydrophobic surface binding protein A-domain-containing protein [Aspergillus alliaceus]